jgi:hypothetical protein
MSMKTFSINNKFSSLEERERPRVRDERDKLLKNEVKLDAESVGENVIVLMRGDFPFLKLRGNLEAKINSDIDGKTSAKAK